MHVLYTLFTKLHNIHYMSCRHAPTVLTKLYNIRPTVCSSCNKTKTEYHCMAFILPMYFCPMLPCPKTASKFVCWFMCNMVSYIYVFWKYTLAAPFV